ncbi:PPOX class F420-dependent oxidoreductase [Solirubrobacter sp. CPCC 204708]|uniref:PPOX class F420-dependent oxidoreductase n=1 Tax=Solirubrobacter deserti TaxID=2282478 RepID=A0ABT4RD89_9ACTN|nr:PPOX class F420-dependent oxidoreductase [Solirubrobacter deserti]MBE2317736.1 PPOX class F420-dependent oxidoreductase [Solirubrobacter deserti]MDA0136487.1 PPOX class F420-dependent oxidoreductase [Solirubrobacter deserti]
MISDDLRALLDATNVAHVATVLPDGGPHTVPVWVGTDGDHVVFLTGPGSRKARNLAGDERVALSLTAAHNPFHMAYLRGHVAERVEGDEAWTIIDRLSHKYLGGPYPRDEERVVFRVAVDHARAGSFG